MSTGNGRATQRGMALISSLLLLVVVTILALSMFRSFGVEEKIAGNVREKQRALHAAESAQQYAEHWLANGNATFGAACTALLSANIGQGQICSAPLVASNDRRVIAGLPWPTLGVTYNPGTGSGLMLLTAAADGQHETYYATPQFYIYDAGPSADGQGELYQIDALGYGASPNAAAIVESTFEVGTGVTDHGGL
jgi:type IV pilus assembly protein PilX